MARTHELKVYNPDGEYVAACKHAEDAAAIIALYGNGATIRVGHDRIVWTEGDEESPAADSYDFVACTVSIRRQA